MVDMTRISDVLMMMSRKFGEVWAGGQKMPLMSKWMQQCTLQTVLLRTLSFAQDHNQTMLHTKAWCSVQRFSKRKTRFNLGLIFNPNLVNTILTPKF